MSDVKTFAAEVQKTQIADQTYTVRELTLTEKIRVFAPIADQLKDAIKNGVERIDLVSFLTNSADVLDNLLKLSVPECKNWSEIPESMTREALSKVLEVNDFGGFFVNFLALAGKISPSQKP